LSRLLGAPVGKPRMISPTAEPKANKSRDGVSRAKSVGGSRSLKICRRKRISPHGEMVALNAALAAHHSERKRAISQAKRHHSEQSEHHHLRRKPHLPFVQKITPTSLDFLEHMCYNRTNVQNISSFYGGNRI